MRHRTGCDRGSGVGGVIHAKMRIASTMLALVLGINLFSATAHALEPQTDLRSRGNLVYQEGEKGAQIYAEDFILLKNSMGSLPDRIFEPACYTHSHRWEYLDVKEETHTRHCEECGSGFDLVSAHKAARIENCTFSYEGMEYPGSRYTCDCGYQWEQEETHTLLFEEADEIGHRIRCRLDGTKFCQGYEPIVEEHYAYYYIPGEDGLHHEKICIDCGYRDEEACCFNLSGNGGSEEDNSGNENDSDKDGDRRYCQCGNVEKADAGDNAENAVTKDVETPKEESSEEQEAETPDHEPGDESDKEPGNESEKESEEETADEEPSEEMPDDESDNELESEMPGDESGAEPRMETPGSESNKDLISETPNDESGAARQDFTQKQRKETRRCT